MSLCSYCRCELPGSETLCQMCFAAGYDRLVHPKPLWNRLRPRLTRGNLIEFFILFVFSFAMLRFDFPLFHARHMKATEAAALISILIACVAFFGKDEGKRKSAIARTTGFETRPTWGRVILFVFCELIAGLLLYAVFTSVSVTLGIVIALPALILIQIDIFDPIRTRSLASRLSAITAVPNVFCLVVWGITDQDVWFRLTLVGGCLMGGLTFVKRREALSW